MTDDDGKERLMKKLVIIYLIFVLLGSRAMARDSIRITTGEWPPYISESLPGYGVVSRIVTEAFKLENIRVEFVLLHFR